MTGCDLKAAMQQLIATATQTLAMQRAALRRYRDSEALNARDALAAAEAGDRRMYDVHLASAATWRAMAERVSRDIEATVRDIAELEQMAGVTSMQEAA